MLFFWVEFTQQTEYLSLLTSIYLDSYNEG